MDAYTPPDTSYGSEDEGSVQVDSQGAPTSSQGSIKVEHWISQAIHGSTTSTTSSSSTQSGGSRAAHRLADVMAQTPMGNHSAPPDVTTYTSEHSIQMERPQGSTGSRTAPKYCNAELMETGDGQRNLEPIKSQHLAPSFYQPLAITSQLPFLWICTFWTPVVRRIVQCMTFGVTFGADIFHV
ncbi:disco-interacting protein 2 homolog C-like isoform X2 [Macaca nemestrina]|uniref:disco-interacting protein 2 homolog C-like isoform X2 n=1 Tax=Macaca nemestrina TaxID=9545 RepID=UPI0039B94855